MHSSSTPAALQRQAQGAAVSSGKVYTALTYPTAAALQVTPASYLELLTTFIKLLAEKRKDIGVSRQRLEAGLSKLLTTAAQVEVMQVHHHLHQSINQFFINRSIQCSAFHSA